MPFDGISSVDFLKVLSNNFHWPVGFAVGKMNASCEWHMNSAYLSPCRFRMTRQSDSSIVFRKKPSSRVRYIMIYKIFKTVRALSLVDRRV